MREGPIVSSSARLRAAAVALACAVFASACAGGTDTDDAAPDPGTVSASAPVDDSAAREADPVPVGETPRRGGTLRVGVPAEADGLNPAANNFTASAFVMGYPVFDPLFAVDENGDTFPWLAESATPIDGGIAWDVRVRPGITFHDGTPLDAAALVANFETAFNDPLISVSLVPFFDAETPVEIVDELTARYHLVEPSLQLPENFVTQIGLIASPTWLADAAQDETLDQEPVGTGPFVFDRRDQDLSTRLVRNERYWRGTEDIHLDALEFFVVTDTAVAAEQVLAAGLDVLITSDPDAILTLRELDGVETVENVLSDEDMVMMNTSQPPFDDLRVRQALTFSTDRQGYHDFIGQDTRPLADSMYHPDLVWNNPSVVQEGNDPDRAAPLIASYCEDVPGQCTGDGRVRMELQFAGPATIDTRTADLLGDGWEPFFDITFDQIPEDQHVVEVAVGQFEAALWRQFGEVDPENESVWLECASATGLIALNWPRYCDEDRDELLFEQRQTADPERRVEVMQEIQVLVNASYTYVFLAHTNWTVGFRDAVRNVCGQTGGPDDTVLLCNSQGRSFFHNTWLDE